MGRMRVRTGDLLDGFLVGEKLHQGGMAEIFSVTKEGIDVPLVMKVPLILDGDDPTMIVSFEQEMTILPRLTGPHVPRCYGVGDFASQPYLVMERIGGASLLARFKQAPLPLDEVVEDKGVRILIDPKAILFLIGTEMDFVRDKMQARFVFNNPNQTSACGCGESVALKQAIQ
jgi:hypothetical protein